MASPEASHGRSAVAPNLDSFRYCLHFAVRSSLLDILRFIEVKVGGVVAAWTPCRQNFFRRLDLRHVAAVSFQPWSALRIRSTKGLSGSADPRNLNTDIARYRSRQPGLRA